MHLPSTENRLKIDLNGCPEESREKERQQETINEIETQESFLKIRTDTHYAFSFIDRYSVLCSADFSMMDIVDHFRVVFSMELFLFKL